jgi:hypothetical protein
MTRMWKTSVALSLLAALTACGSDKKNDPSPTTTAKPTTPAPTTPPPTTPPPTTPPAMPPPDPNSPLAIIEEPGDASCFGYRIERGGAVVVRPKAVAAALECPIVPPVLTPKRDAVVLFGGEELSYWAPGSEPKRLVMFDPGVEGVSAPTWSPDGTRLAVVVKGTSYPEATRLFVLTLSATGDVTDKVKHDVAVFSPCGSVCTPQAVTWKDAKTVEVTTPGEGEPGPVKAIKL